MSPNVGVESSIALLQWLSDTEDKKERKKARSVFHKDWMDYQTLWDLRSRSRGAVWLCPLVMYSSIWEGRCAATYKLFICVDVHCWSLPVQKTERNRCFWSFWRHERGPCGQVQLFVTLTISKSFFFSPCYSCHPCFLLYYSIFEWCQVLYMVWIYVCEEKIVSQYRKMLYFCYEIYQAYLYSSRNYVRFLCRGRTFVFNPAEKMQKIGRGGEAQAQTWQPHSLWSYLNIR